MDIKYIAHFDHPSNENEGRVYALSASAKIEYISEVLSRIGHNVLIVSPSQTRHRKYYPGKIVRINPMVRLKLFPTFPRGHVGQRTFRILAGKALLLSYLLLHTRRNEPVVVYHSLSFQRAVSIAKAVRRFRLILEVEEIYQDAVPASRFNRRAEYELFKRADAFIFSTELLNDKLNPRGKPHAIVYGTYRTSRLTESPARDGVTHVVYAGTLNPGKGGAAAAVAAAAYLDETYHVHIIGFGSDRDLQIIQDIISEVNSTSRVRVSYDGVLQGAEYSNFLGRCDIGLSTQDPTALFNNTSFPSKILTYLAHGLKVVTVRIPAVERFPGSHELYYYDHQEPSEIAATIRRAAHSQRSGSIALLQHLDENFESQLRAMLSPNVSEHPGGDKMWHESR